MNAPPSVSVLLPVYNAQRYLTDAVNSILYQTYTDFELIIVDDASQDNSWSILQRISNMAPRIQLHRNEKNLGLARTLNIGLTLARGRYIARMDADDIALPQRLKKQVTYLENHPQTGLLGTNIRYIDTKNQFLVPHKPKHESPESPVVIRWHLLWHNVIYHPTVMIRACLLANTGYRYDENLVAAQDYDLWTRLLPHCKVARLHEVLVHYRIHETSISRAKRQQQHEITGRIVQRELATIANDTPTETIAALARSITSKTIEFDQIKPAFDLLNFIYDKYTERDMSEVDYSQITEDMVTRCLRFVDVYAHSHFVLSMQLLQTIYKRFKSKLPPSLLAQQFAKAVLRRLIG